ncbi:MAG: Mut7-C RNAse domain-containing protein [Thermodesulfobacteriota bacterium]
MAGIVTLAGSPPRSAGQDAIITFQGWLGGLVARRRSDTPIVHYPVERRASVKDVIEALGVPHTEVGRLTANDQEVDFSYLLAPGDEVMVEPLAPPVDVTTATLLRPEPLPALRFLIDHNVAKLAARLRMAGFDTLFHPEWHDEELALESRRQQCILLTRDVQLLKRKGVEYGHLVREERPTRQLAEILHFYGLNKAVRPFGRCLRCNAPLHEVAKEEIIDHLEPLTKKYYHSFRRCPACGRIYWAGSHHAKMVRLLAELVHYQPLPY